MRPRQSEGLPAVGLNPCSPHKFLVPWRFSVSSDPILGPNCLMMGKLRLGGGAKLYYYLEYARPRQKQPTLW